MVKELETYYNVFPWHVNHFGSLHGGIYMSWLIDSSGLLMSALSKGNYLLASVDYIYLIRPARIGDLVRIKAVATASWSSSVEMKVKACLKRGDKEELGALSMMTYVAVDEHNRPRLLQTEVGHDEEADKRRQARLARKKKDSEDTSDLLEGMSFGKYYVRTIYPEHGFANGILYAGKMYQMLDEALAIVAKLYTKGNVFTAGAGYADFMNPVRIGDILEIQGAVEYTGNTSLDVGAKVFAINHFTGEKRLVSRTVFSFVAIDDKGNPRQIPKLTPATEKEKRLFAEREEERKTRINLSKELQKVETCD